MKKGDMARGHFRKGDAITAMAAGTAIAFGLNVWYRIVSPESIDRYLWLTRIHEPAARLAERLFYFLYPRIGNPWSLRCAVVYGYVVLVSMWALAAFAVLKIGRLVIGFEAQFRNLFLLSLVICGAGYLGLALTHIPVYSVAGMTWSLAVLATWIVTMIIAFRRCGRKAIWLLLETPVVLLPFYGVFLVGL